MTKMNALIGYVRVTFSDGNIESIKISKSGRTIYINKDIVHPINRGSIDGVIHEISVLRNKPIEKWDCEKGPYCKI